MGCSIFLIIEEIGGSINQSFLFGKYDGDEIILIGNFTVYTGSLFNLITSKYLMNGFSSTSKIFVRTGVNPSLGVVSDNDFICKYN